MRYSRSPSVLRRNHNRCVAFSLRKSLLHNACKSKWTLENCSKRMQLEPHPSQFPSLRETGQAVNAWLIADGFCSRRQVSAKAQGGLKIHGSLIDGPGGSRYSQAQILDLVAYANPRSRKAAQSLSMALTRARRPPLQSTVPYPPAPAGRRVRLRGLASCTAVSGSRHRFTSTSQCCLEDIETLEDRSGDYAQP
jgi:hypothetical protein